MKPCFTRVLLATLLAAAACSALAEDLYRWVDEQGKAHYGNTPPLEILHPQQIKFPDATLPDAELPYETRRAKEAFPVTLYVSDNCKGPCQRARDLLNSRGIPFTQKNMVTQEDLDIFRELSGGAFVPVLVVGNNLLKGFLAEQWNNELDIAGYPKTAPYGFRPIAPPQPALPPAQPDSAQTATPPSGLVPAENNKQPD
ncbi:MAG: glutaredoxin family protein [Gallionellaceae bacterium]|nr:glutaredoxin family protein [Gallionellaceae bacterium]